MGVCNQRHAPAVLTPRKRPRTHCTGGWLGSRVSLDGCSKSHSACIRSPERPPQSEFIHRLSYPDPLSLENGSEPDRQGMYNITLTRVRGTIVGVGKQ